MELVEKNIIETKTMNTYLQLPMNCGRISCKNEHLPCKSTRNHCLFSSYDFKIPRKHFTGAGKIPRNFTM